MANDFDETGDDSIESDGADEPIGGTDKQDGFSGSESGKPARFERVATIELGAGGAADTRASIDVGDQPRKRKSRSPNGTRRDTGVSGKARPSLAVDRKKFCRQLVGGHQAAAMLLRSPALVITDTEGDALGNAILDVFELYDIKVSPAAIAWMNLLGVAATVYVPRVAVVVMAKKKAQAERARASFSAGQPPVAPSVQTAPQARQQQPGGKIHPATGLPIS